MSLFFINALAYPARRFFLTHCSSHMEYSQIVGIMKRHYNSDTRKLQIQSEMDSLELGSFMRKRQYTDHAQALAKMIDHINALAPQLPQGFGDDHHKTRYLRRAVMGFNWAQQPISQMTTARYSFNQFITSLQESLQLQEEMSRARAQDINYGQYTTHSHSVRHPNNRRGGKGRTWSPRRQDGRYSTSDRSRSPYNRQNSDSSRSPAWRNRRGGYGATRSGNPMIRSRRYCYGCGSPEHILSDNKCTPSLESIRTNVLQEIHGGDEVAEAMAEQIFNLHCASRSASHGTPRRNQEQPSHVHFEESVYAADEEEKLESYIATAFEENSSNYFRTYFHRRGELSDFSRIHLANHPDPSQLPGFCVDLGAPRSVIGKRQLDTILRKMDRQTIPRMPSTSSFRFGDTVVKSLGMVELALKTPAPRRPIAVLLDIVPVDVPALLGLDVLDAEALYADNVTNRLVHRSITSNRGGSQKYHDVWSVPLQRHDGHLYAKMSFPKSMFYTVKELEKLHRQFAHPSVEKLYNLLKTAGLDAVDSSTHQILEEIVVRCEQAYIDIMYLEGRPVLHIVDAATRFSAARFLTKVSTESVWEAIIMCWSSVYTGLPHCIRVDEGTQFRKIFAELSALHDVEIKKSGIQSHNSLGVGERYHKPLRDTYRKLKLDHPSMQRQVLLAVAVKAMNDTLGPEGVVPSALVFGEFPSLRTFEGPVIPRPSLAERALAAQEARRYMARHLAEVRIKRALHHQTPSATDKHISLATRYLSGARNLSKIASANGQDPTQYVAMTPRPA